MHLSRRAALFAPVLMLAVLAPATASLAADAASCGHTVWADVVALDQPIMINRLGTVRPGGMIYALRRDVVATNGEATLAPGKVQLRADRRPRPLTLRVNKGDCLKIKFQNLLSPAQYDVLQTNTRAASIHVEGMELRNSMSDDGSDAGVNNKRAAAAKGIVAPGETTEYVLYAPDEGTHLLYSTTADFNGFNPDQLTFGLFGAVNVEPVNAEWYRSQVSEADLRQATTNHTPDNHPVVDYSAVFQDGPRRGLPVLAMRAKTDTATHAGADYEIVWGDLTAVITGQNHRRFTREERPDSPNADLLPDRQEPYREVTVIYNEAQDAVQPFPQVYNVSTPGTTNGLDNTDFSAGTDGFAINYGSAGIVNEILANRMALGPAKDCPECKFEEFFLSSWPNGDPAMVVDNPANLPCVSTPLAQNEPLAHTQQFLPDTPGTAIPWPPCFPNGKAQATKVFYPDDPSNVYHTYLGDHAVFRILHAGASVHHVHHHHAHQWLWAPMMKGSNYLDSQSIGPGASFTLELVYAGSGNQNLTAGDSIFHCHFYPHFASGMWALFRVHDTFEAGTQLDADGRPVPHSRALPDPEIKTGTPTPAVVPLPTLAMAPMPAPVEIIDGQVHFAQTPTANPGYPYFVPGLAGHRPPHPPLAFDADGTNVLDGGLPRHLVLGGHVSRMVQSASDFTKDLDEINAIQLPEKGTLVEQLAMDAHSRRLTDSFLPDGAAGKFTTNGMPPIGGGPFADPAPYNDTKTMPPERKYRGADIQVNAVFNKAGWHYPQQRIRALWNDVKDIEGGIKPPEPLFIRGQVGELITYSQSNLVPAYYELDDFQVRTPTDIIGQHIHLVKFDVLAADGAANGFNYEDGTFSPQEVRDRIADINKDGGLCQPALAANVPTTCPDGTPRQTLTPKVIPELGNGPRDAWVGAQATLHAWYIDPLGGRPSSYMTVFTHDHFSPSTHQEAGLYAGVLVEPKDSVWTSLDGRTKFGTRDDGGPTSFAANIILPGNQRADSYREFALEWQDTQLAYGPASKVKADCYAGQTPKIDDCNEVKPGSYTGWQTTDAAPSFAINALNPPRQPNAINIPPPAGTLPETPFGRTPFIITDFGFGISSLNYRAEPLTLRDLPGPVPAGKEATDAAYAFGSITRHNAALNIQPSGQQIDPNCKGGPVTKGGPCPVFPEQAIGGGMEGQDPYTPLLRAYPKDKIQIRTLVGGFTTMHDFTTHGPPWKFEPYVENSGYRSSEFEVLSEHFEMLFDAATAGDYLYQPGASYEGMVNGLWGLLRVYDKQADGLAALPDNPPAVAPEAKPAANTPACTDGTPCLRHFDVSAVSVKQLIGDHGLVYNGRGVPTIDPNTGVIVYQKSETLSDPDAIVYIRDEDLCTTCKSGAMLKNPDTKIEPLLLRVAAGDQVEVTLHNRLDVNEKVFKDGEPASRMGLYTTSYYFNPFLPLGNDGLKPATFTPSTQVALHPQLLALDVQTDDGAAVGKNPDTTVVPGQSRTYRWYAGIVKPDAAGKPQSKPVEFGAVNLLPADSLMQAYHGLFGGLIVEPAGATWVDDPDTQLFATVFLPDGASFRDFTLFMQNDPALQLNGTPFTPVVNGNPTFSALSAVNYRTEPFFYRYGQRIAGIWSGGGPVPKDWTKLTAADLTQINSLNWPGTETSEAIANSLVGGDPATPILGVPAGMPARIRLLGPQGNGDNQQTFELYGHTWQFQPYQQDSAMIGDNPASPSTGTQGGVGPTAHYDIVLPSAGGAFKVPGDYLWRSADALQFQVGVWGLMRVAPVEQPLAGGYPDTVSIVSVAEDNAGGHPSCTATWTSTIRPAADQAMRHYPASFKLEANGRSIPATVQGKDGHYSASIPCPLPGHIKIASEYGGVAEWWAPGGGPALATGVLATAASKQPPVAAMPVRSAPRFHTLRLGHAE